MKSQYQLRYLEGELNNHYFRQIVDDCSALIESILQEYDAKTEFTLVIMDQNGICGYIDHIVMSRIASFVFVKIWVYDTRLSALHYFCVWERLLRTVDISFVFRSKGHSASEIDITNDISEVFELKKRIMRAHFSQRGHAEMLIVRAEEAIQLTETFYTVKD